MLRTRPLWMRGLQLYHVRPGDPAGSLTVGDEYDDLLTRVHACSRFRSVTDAARLAVYSVHDRDAPLRRETAAHHTLVAVREFRRVPLQATALALALFTARPSCTAHVVAALAHYVERAVSLYQPAYLLLAHSLEEPRLSALLTGVHECAALQAAGAAAFSVDALLPELRPRLAAEPEWFAYCPEREVQPVVSPVSPYAV